MSFHPLESIRTRSLLYWLAIVFVFLVIISAMELDEALNYFTFSILTYSTIFLWIYVHYFSKGIKLKPYIKSFKESYIVEGFLLIIILMAFSICTYWIVMLLVAELDPEFALEELNQKLFLTKEQSPYYKYYNYYLYFDVIILAPLMEELFFRGILFQRLSYKWGVTNGVILSSFFFAVLHGFDFIGAFVFAVVLCLVYVKSKSLVLPFLIHLGNNAIALFLPIEDKSYKDIQEFYTESYSEITAIVIILVISLAILTFYIHKNRIKELDIYPYYSYDWYSLDEVEKKLEKEEL